MKQTIMMASLLLAFGAQAGVLSPAAEGGDASATAQQTQGQGQAQEQGQGQSQNSNNINGNSNSNKNTNNNSNANFNSNSSRSASNAAAISGSVSGAASKSTSTSSSGGNIQGQSVGTSVTLTNDTDVRPAASAPAISLTSVGTDNCLGSVSGSFGNGFISLGGGATTESTECNRRAYSRALRDLGLKDAAIALLCKNPEVASVTAECKGEVAPAPANAAAAAQKDSIVCKRTGERC